MYKLRTILFTIAGYSYYSNPLELEEVSAKIFLLHCIKATTKNIKKKSCFCFVFCQIAYTLSDADNRL